MRRLCALTLALLVMGIAASGQHFYAFYYDRSGGQDLEINLLNTMPDPAQITLRAYDAYGKPLWTASDTLAGYTGGFVQLSRYIPEAAEHWGVVTVESGERLVIALEYLVDGERASVDHVSQEVPELTADEPYWLGAYYSQVGDASTGLVVMNPWNEAVACAITVYRQDGRVVYEAELFLNPHESEYYSLEKIIGHGPYLWGLVDIRMVGKAVVAAVEYYGRGLRVDNITQYYF